MKHRIASIGFLLLILWLPASGQTAGNLIRYTGTFSSLAFNKEAGDLLGAELRIALVREGYEGVLQIAEGGPGQLMLVGISFDKDKVAFVIPEKYATYGGGEFSGTIDSRKIRGVLKFKNGAEMRLTMPRKRSYWD